MKIKNSLVVGSVGGNVTVNSHHVAAPAKTHAEQEQRLLTYLQTYREVISLSKLAQAAGVDNMTLSFFVREQRGLSPEALAKCLAYLKKQAEAMLVFI